MDSPTTFFYLDPPYPGGSGQRKDYAYGAEFDINDLLGMCEQLKTIQGKFMMSIPAVVYDYVKPFGFQIEYIGTPVLIGQQRVATRELVMLNYTPTPTQDAEVIQPGAGASTPSPVAQSEVTKAEDIAQIEVVELSKSEEQRLAWIVVMKPDFVDHEGHWADEESIMRICHKYMLKGCPVWLEHQVDISDRVDIVQNYTLLADLQMGDRLIKKGSWIIVAHCHDREVWSWFKTQKVTGGSVRGMAELAVGKSPDPEKAERVA
jgi:hypothetical protein